MTTFKLKSIRTLDDKMKALQIYTSDEAFFRASTSEPISMETIDNDKSALPPQTHFTQKKYRLIYFEDRLIGVVDYIYDYPAVGSVYVGLLLLDKQLQGNGLGKQFMVFFESKIRQEGYNEIYLSVIDSHVKSKQFWTTMGFNAYDTKFTQVGNVSNIPVIMMKKSI